MNLYDTSYEIDLDGIKFNKNFVVFSPKIDGGHLVLKCHKKLYIKS